MVVHKECKVDPVEYIPDTSPYQYKAEHDTKISCKITDSSVIFMSHVQKFIIFGFVR